MPARRGRADFLADLARRLAPGTGSRPAVPASGTSRSFLLSPVRRRLLQLLARRPCVAAASLARSAGLATPTVRWHLRRLEEGRFVERALLPGLQRAVYLPTGFALPAETGDLYLLQARRVESIIDLARRWDLLRRRDLLRLTGARARSLDRSLARLVAARLLIAIRDGPQVRYRVGPRLGALQQRFRRDAGRFAVHIRQLGTAEGLVAGRPTRSRDTVLVNFETGPGAVALLLASTPETVGGRAAPRRMARIDAPRRGG